MNLIKFFNEDTQQWEYADDVEGVSKEYVDSTLANMVSEDVSGEVIAVDDVSGIEQKIEVKASGKNLLDKIFPANDRNVFAGKNPNTPSSYEPIVFKKGVTYTASYKEALTGIFIQTTEAVPVFTTNYVSSITFTPTQTFDGSIQFFNSSSSPPIDIAKLQLELGTTATPYSPYISPQEIASVNVEVCGLNISNFNTEEPTVKGTYFGWQLPKIQGDLTLTLVNKKPSEPIPTDWFFGFTSNGNDSTGGVNWILAGGKIINKYLTDSSKKFLSFFANFKVADLPKFKEHFDVMVYFGKEQLEYEPYQCTSYPIGDDLSVTANSISPNMTIYADKDGILLDTTYKVNFKKWFNNQLKKPIVASPMAMPMTMQEPINDKPTNDEAVANNETTNEL